MGYTRIVGAMSNLGYEVGRNTVKRILQEAGIPPAPERGKGMSWHVFLRAHWEAIAAADFFTVEVLSIQGLTRYFVFFVIELKTRRVEIVGIVQRIVAAYVEHCHAERNHQGLNNRLITPNRPTGNTGSEVFRRQRLGGLLNYYERAAA